MKNLICTFYCLILSGIMTSIAVYGQENSEMTPFSIKGEISGLIPGDTLVFERIALPNWDMESAFDVIISEPDRFFYKGLHPHTQYYLMTYKPVSGKAPEADRRGLTLLIKNEEITISGVADYIYYSMLNGGIYDDPGYQQIMELDNSLGMRRGDYSRLMNEARDLGDTLKMKEYLDKFNSYHIDHKGDYEKLRKLEKEFFEEFLSSELAVIEMLQRVSNTSMDKLLSSYEKMNSDIQESYYGNILKRQIDRRLSLEPGNDAPGFELITIDNNKISLDDLKGFYVLIYHWGLCPGSVMIDGDVIRLYQKYKDKLKVVGVTESIDMIRGVNEDTKPGDKFFGVEFKPVLENMLIHPWYDVEKTESNKRIADDYFFGGYPFFVFISPEGKIIARGFHDAFYKAKEVMETEFGK